MPLSPWYVQPFDGLTDGALEGQDAWTKFAYPPFVAGGIASVTSVPAKVIDGTKSLSHTAVRGKANFYTRALQAHNNYDISWKWKLQSATSGTANFQLWLRQTASLSNVSFGIITQTSLNRILIAQAGTPAFYPIAVMGTPHTVRVTVNPLYAMEVFVDAVSVFTGFAKPFVPDLLYLSSTMGGPIGANAEFIYDTFNFQFVTPTSPAIPKAPENVFAIRRNKYTVVSWDRTTRNVTNDIIVRGGGATDILSVPNIQSSVVVTEEIIGGLTRTSNLAIEGVDYNVNRSTGVITWLGTAKQPDTGTDYHIAYENLLNDVTKYQLFNSTLINESDMILKTTIDSTDVSGKIDTVYVDTDIDTSKVYRVKSLVISGPDVLESELSGRAVAIQDPSQIDSKGEVIDTKLFVLGSSALDEGILA